MFILCIAKVKVAIAIVNLMLAINQRGGYNYLPIASYSFNLTKDDSKVKVANAGCMHGIAITIAIAK